MPFQTTKEIKSLARGGVSVGAHQPISKVSFTDDMWAALIKEGAIIEVNTEPASEPETETEPAPKVVTKRKPRAKKVNP